MSKGVSATKLHACERSKEPHPKNVPVVFAADEDQKPIKVFLVSSRMERDEDRVWPQTRSVADAKNARQKIAFALK